MDDNQYIRAKGNSLLELYPSYKDRLMKIVNSSTCALSPLIFSNDNLSSINYLIAKLKKMCEMYTSNRIQFYIQKMGGTIHDLYEMAYLNNFYNDALRLLQEKIRALLEISLSTPIEHLPEPEIRWIVYLKTTLPSCISLSFTPTFFESDNNPLVLLNFEASKKFESPEFKNLTPTMQSIKNCLIEMFTIAKIVQDAYIFLQNLYALETMLKQVEFEQKGTIDQLKNSIIVLEQKEKTWNQNNSNSLTCAQIISLANSTKDIQSPEVINQFLSSFREMFKEAYENEFHFESCLNIIESLTTFVSQLFPIPNSNRHTIHTYTEFTFNFSNSLAELYKLPKKLINPSEVVMFNLELSKVSETFQKFKTLELPFNWTQDMMKEFESKVKNYVNIGKIILNATTLVLHANTILENAEFLVDISNLLLPKIDLNFSEIEFTESLELRQTSARKILSNFSLPDIMTKTDELNLSPANLFGTLQSILTKFIEIDKDIVTFFRTKYGLQTQLIPKNIFVSYIEKIKNLILTADTIPLEITNIMKVFYTLFEMGLTTEIAAKVIPALQELAKFFNVYSIFCRLDYNGIASLSFCSLISYILTVLSGFKPTTPVVVPLINYLEKINILDINFKVFSAKVSEFDDILHSIYTQFSLDAEAELVSKIKEVAQKLLTIPQLIPLISILLKLNFKGNYPTYVDYIVNDYETKSATVKDSCYSVFENMNTLRALLKQLLDMVNFRPLLIHITVILTKLMKFTNETIRLSKDPESSHIDILQYISKDSGVFMSFYSGTHEQIQLEFNKGENRQENLHENTQVRPTLQLGKLPIISYFTLCKEEWNFAGIINMFLDIEHTVNNGSKENIENSILEVSKNVCLKIKDYLKSIITQLSDFSHRSSRSTMQTTVHEREISRQISNISSRISVDNLQWIQMLIDLSFAVQNSFGITDVTTTQLHPIIALRSLSIRSHALGSLLECTKNHPFDLDFKLISYFILSIMMNRSFVIQMQENLASNLYRICSEPFNIANVYNTFKTFSDSKLIFNIFEMVKCSLIDTILISHHSKRSGLLSNSIDQAAKTADKSVIYRFVSSDFNRDFIGNEIMELTDSKKTPNNELICQSLLSLQCIVDIAKYSDMIVPLVIKGSSKEVSGLSLIALEFLICEIKFYCQNLLQIKPSDCISLYNNIVLFYSEFLQIFSKFSPISRENAKKLPEKFNNFVKSFNHINFVKFIDSFSASILDLEGFLEENLKYQEEISDIKTLQTIYKQMRASPSKETVSKTIFCIEFLADKDSRSEVRNFADQCIASLKAISLLFDIYDVSSLFSSKLKSITGVEVVVNPISFESTEGEERTLNIPGLINEQLSMFDQTALFTMTASLFDANIRARESLDTVKNIERDIKKQTMKISELTMNIEALEEAKMILSSKENIQKEQIQFKAEEEEVVEEKNEEENEVHLPSDEVEKNYESTMKNLYKAQKHKFDLRDKLLFRKIQSTKSTNVQTANSIASQNKSLIESINSWKNIYQ